jgi:ABC-type dipeptide/oligopeptide/nickel transport system permease component
VTAYLIRRLVGALWVLLGVATTVFLVLHLTGDPAAVMMPLEATADQVAQFRHEEGFDRPLIVQYGTFLWALLHGNFGDSLRHGEPALGLALQRLPASGELALTALTLALLIAIPAGILAAVRRNSLLDLGARVFALLGQSAPVYWLGLMLILIFGVQLGWFPVSGIGGVRHLILPAITLGLFSMAKIMRLTRSAMLDILRSDFLRTAQAKGVQPLRLITHHALRNAWIPIVTVIGIELGTLLSQAIITETVFSWPGIGRLAVQAIYDRDYPVVEVVVLIAALSFVLINLAVDLAYAALDPRIRYD